MGPNIYGGQGKLPAFCRDQPGKLLIIPNSGGINPLRRSQKPLKLLLLGNQPLAVLGQNLPNGGRVSLHPPDFLQRKPGPAQGGDGVQSLHILFGVFPVIPAVPALYTGGQKSLLHIETDGPLLQAGSLGKLLRFHGNPSFRE